MRRGSLRVYLGAAPGVGKTFAMLNEGCRRAERGTDVVVGFVEVHGRRLTAEQVRDLEVVPRRKLVYRGASFEAVVAAVAAGSGRVGGLIAATAAALSYNFFFTSPYYSLRIDSASQVVTVLLLFLAGLLASFVGGLQRRLRSAHRQEEAALVLVHQVVRTRAEGGDAPRAAVSEIWRLLGARWVAVVRWPSAPAFPEWSRRTACGTPPSPPPWTPAARYATCRTSPATPTRARPAATIVPASGPGCGDRWTASAPEPRARTGATRPADASRALRFASRPGEPPTAALDPPQDPRRQVGRSDAKAPQRRRRDGWSRTADVGAAGATGLRARQGRSAARRVLRTARGDP